MFCVKCGNKLDDDARFCSKCGTPVTVTAPAAQNAEVPAAAPVQNPEPGIHVQSVPSPVPAGKNIRYKCSCGAVLDMKEGQTCSKCGKPLDENCGYYKLYRVGSPMGIAAGFGIYIDGEPYGHIGNKQTCWIRLPFGKHNVHIAAGMSRKCTDMTFELSPSHPLECAKVHMRVGAFTNSFVIEPAQNADVPD